MDKDKVNTKITESVEGLEKSGANIKHFNASGIDFDINGFNHLIVLSEGELILISNGVNIAFDELKTSNVQNIIRFIRFESTVCTINL